MMEKLFADQSVHTEWRQIPEAQTHTEKKEFKLAMIDGRLWIWMGKKSTQKLLSHVKEVHDEMSSDLLDAQWLSDILLAFLLYALGTRCDSPIVIVKDESKAHEIDRWAEVRAKGVSNFHVKRVFEARLKLMQIVFIRMLDIPLTTCHSLSIQNK